MTDPTPADIPTLVAEPDDSIGREIYPRGKPVTVTARHVEIAKLLYAARPFVMGSTPTTFGATIGKSFDWDGAPAYYQTDMLELADAVLPALLEALSPQCGGNYSAVRDHGTDCAVGGGEADIKLFVTELLSHRGERPWRVLKGGQELWETWVPAVKAAFAAAPPTPAVEGIPAGMVAWGPSHPDYPNAPSDWDGGEMLCREGCRLNGHAGGEPFWDHSFGSGDIIAYTPQARPTASDGEAREHALRVANDAAALAHQPALASAGVRKALQRCADAILAALPTTDGAARLMADIDRLFDLHGDARCDECGAPLFNEDETTTDEAETVALCAGHREAGAPIYAYRIATPPTTDARERMREAEG